MCSKYHIDISSNFKYKISEAFRYNPANTSTSTLFWLDGTLSGNVFLDKSGNGRNFTITDKDFTTNYFPYKSAATISAPVNDAVLIAADINNFLYDSGGDPNEIPVTSFFQNIDYEDKLFCRHVAQAVDGNGVETQEPYVTDIVLYSSVLTGSDLSTANSFYGVPTEETGAVKWVDPVSGNDTTGDGSKLLPWRTLPKSTSADIGDTIYVKSGATVLGAIWDNRKVLHHKFIGFNQTSGNYIYVSDGSMEGLNMNGTGLTRCIFTLAIVTPTFNRCKFLNSDKPIIGNTTGSFILNTCIITGHTVNAIQGLGPTITVNTCLINGTPTAIGNKAASADVSILNSKISGNGILGQIAGGATAELNDVTIKGSTLISTSGLITTYDYNDANLSYNDITVAGSLLEASIATPSVSNVIIEGNTTTSTGTALIRPHNKNLIVRNDKITYNAASGNMINHTATDSVTTSITGNSLVTLDGSAPISIGDGTFAIQHKITGEIANNRIIGYDSIPNSHGTSIWANKGIAVHHNFMSGWHLNIVLKGGNSDYSTNPIYSNIIMDGSITMRGVSNVPIYGNTFINIDQIYTAVAMSTDELANESLNIQLKNNIFINGFDDSESKLIAVQDNSTLVSDYNLFYNNNAGKIVLIGAAIKSFAEWQALGYDANSKLLTETQLTELFTDIDNDDFSLPAGSEAIGAGEILAAAYDDGLDDSTDWGDLDTLPVIVTKQQTVPWDAGAYVS